MKRVLLLLSSVLFLIPFAGCFSPDIMLFGATKQEPLKVEKSGGYGDGLNDLIISQRISIVEERINRIKPCTCGTDGPKRSSSKCHCGCEFSSCDCGPTCPDCDCGKTKPKALIKPEEPKKVELKKIELKKIELKKAEPKKVFVEDGGGSCGPGGCSTGRGGFFRGRR